MEFVLRKSKVKRVEAMMEAKNLSEFKSLFLSMKKNLIQNISSVKGELTGLGKGDTADQVWEEKEKEIGLKIYGRQLFFIKKINNALRKIESGEFGHCEDCGEDISITRLKARPTAHLCIHCKDEQERGETHLLYQKKSHTLGKKLTDHNLHQLPMNEEKGPGRGIMILQGN